MASLNETIKEQIREIMLRDVLPITPDLAHIFALIPGKDSQPTQATSEIIARANFVASHVFPKDKIAAKRKTADSFAEPLFVFELDVDEMAPYYKSFAEPSLAEDKIVEHAKPHIETLLRKGKELFRLFTPYQTLFEGADLDEKFTDVGKDQSSFDKLQLKKIALYRVFRLATLLHDIGNYGGKHEHTETGAIASYYFLQSLGLDRDICNMVSGIIALHTKSPLHLFDGKQLKGEVLVLTEDSILGQKGDDITAELFLISSILFLADKFDIRGSRVSQDMGGLWLQHIRLPTENVHYHQNIISRGPFLQISENDDLTAVYNIDPAQVLFHASLDLIYASSGKLYTQNINKAIDHHITGVNGLVLRAYSVAQKILEEAGNAAALITVESSDLSSILGNLQLAAETYTLSIGDIENTVALLKPYIENLVIQRTYDGLRECLLDFPKVIVKTVEIIHQGAIKIKDQKMPDEWDNRLILLDDTLQRAKDEGTLTEKSLTEAFFEFSHEGLAKHLSEIGTLYQTQLNQAAKILQSITRNSKSRLVLQADLQFKDGVINIFDSDTG